MGQGLHIQQEVVVTNQALAEVWGRELGMELGQELGQVLEKG
jgi:hypothetical protein